MGWGSWAGSAWSAVKSAAKKVGQAVSSGVIQVTNIVKEAVNLIISLPDMILTLLGIMPPKKLRFRVHVLRNESDLPLIDPKLNRLDWDHLQTAVDEARRIFRKEVHVILVPMRRGGGVDIIDDAAPTSALDVHCSSGGPGSLGAFGDEVTEAGVFLREHTTLNISGGLTGYASPVNVFIVRDVRGKNGCSLGPLTDYVTVDLDGVNNSPYWTLAHEMGHACNLPHRGAGDSLMRPSQDGAKRKDYLKRWQKVVFRASRHVTYI